MALFKITRGDSSNLPLSKTDGWAYFCTDTGEFYIDYVDSEGNIQRKQINESDLSAIGTKISTLESQVDGITAIPDADITALFST